MPSIKILSLPFAYLRWHFRHSIFDALRIWKDFILFFWNFFSISLLFKTLFKPWKRLSEAREKGFDPQNIMEVLILNSVMRIIGLFLRLAVIFVGLITELAVIAIGFIILLFWFLAPLTAPLLILIGAALLL